MSSLPKKKRHIVFLVLPSSILLDVSGPLEVFVSAKAEPVFHTNKIDFEYEIHIVSSTRKKVIDMASGVSIICERTYKEVNFPIDTLIVVGLYPQWNTMDASVLSWMQQQFPKVRRVCSVCVATFALAEAGILNGKRATTHWQFCAKLAKDFTQIQVDPESIFVKDGNVYTSAGVTAGMDMALALVEEDLGRDCALSVARTLVLFLKRPGNQSQYSITLEGQNVDFQPIRKALDWIYDHISKPMTIETLAEQVSMSPRNFARVFAREMDVTPAKYIEKLRLETACRYLVEKQWTLDEVSFHCGLKNSENIRRLFLKYYEVTPTQYRRNFQTSTRQKSLVPVI
ncbi:MAG: GlxA family transcriptional regulator [Bacteroidales bacterium]|nr:GlxA family transcriptional regulator [Bacteroidales bacterium]